jgi:catechol 2,3-dioxygenase
VAISVKNVGHVVLKVRDLERAAVFYRDMLGLTEVARFKGRMAFFSAGTNHHDLAVLALGPEARPAPADAVGLYHVALKIGDRLEDLRAAKAHLEARGISVRRTANHRVSQSIYIEDPDGNGIELFVDADPTIWQENPAAVATVEPLDL